MTDALVRCDACGWLRPGELVLLCPFCSGKFCPTHRRLHSCTGR